MGKAMERIEFSKINILINREGVSGKSNEISSAPTVYERDVFLSFFTNYSVVCYSYVTSPLKRAP